MTTPSGMPFRWALAQPIGIVERDGITYVATFPDGPIVVLDPVAATILAIALDEPADEVTGAVAAAYEKPSDEVEEAVRDVLTRLEADRVIRRDHR
ncbi:MAG: hypothetical protein IPF90_00970 [Actinomycetales bacterium]|nr:hypothetical protein [Candidatus Phosphoribacter baldrii]